MEKQWMALPISYLYKQKAGDILHIDMTVMAEMLCQLQASERANQWQETGGMLGCDNEGRVVAFYFDVLGSRKSNANTYCPDGKGMETVAKLWENRSIKFAGIIHTHSESVDFLSGTDLLFTQKLLRSNPTLEKLFMPVLAGSNLIVYAFERDYLEWAEKMPSSKSQISPCHSYYPLCLSP